MNSKHKAVNLQPAIKNSLVLQGNLIIKSGVALFLPPYFLLFLVSSVHSKIFAVIKSEVVVEWSVFLFTVRQVSDSKLGLETCRTNRILTHSQRKVGSALVSRVMSLCLSCNMSRTDEWIWIGGFRITFVNAFQFWLKSVNNGYSAWGPTHISVRILNASRQMSVWTESVSSRDREMLTRYISVYLQVLRNSR